MMASEMLRAFREGGEGMWFLLGLLVAGLALLVLVGITLAVLRPRPFWRFLAAVGFSAIAVMTAGVAIGFHALGNAKLERAIVSAAIDPETKTRIHAQGEAELRWLYLFAPIAAAPALLGAFGAAGFGAWGAARRDPP
ncbi:MAG TPA: hypothetical protein VMV18_13405 [bacterium]|nr:hypothetical protein [bacterium]